MAANAVPSSLPQLVNVQPRWGWPSSQCRCEGVAQSVHVQAVGWQVRPGPGLTETGDGTDHQMRPLPAHLGEIDTVSGPEAGQLILDDHVGLAGELDDELAVFRLADIERDGPLAPVLCHVLRAFGVVPNGGTYRMRSPRGGCSTLTTSAPRAASLPEVKAAGMRMPRSKTRTPRSG